MPEPAGKTGSILVVDDQEINRRLLEAMLVPLGYQVIQAADGEQALKLAREEQPDLVLLDIMMPGMDGFEVAHRLKSDPATRNISIVMVTALKEVESKVRALEAGADDFLTKPVDKAELQARVRSQLQVKAYHDHLLHYQQELQAEVARRTAQLRKAYREVKNASLDTIHRLAKAAEFKDEETGAHIKRMSNYAAEVARTMGLPEATVEAILYAAPMHDVGKIGIPDKVLLKPGRLSPSEWEIMKTHAEIGAQILSGAKRGFLKLAEVVAMTHHEKWDGSGYPRGLKGHDIPLVGRIVTIADVFDALTSKRPYKEAFSLEKSLDIIKEEKGRHFDPQVVEAFLSCLDNILAIKEQFPDQQESPLVRMAHKLNQT